jgi:hypothetical protein
MEALLRKGFCISRCMYTLLGNRDLRDSINLIYPLGIGCIMQRGEYGKSQMRLLDIV